MISCIDLDPEKNISFSKQPSLYKGGKKGYGDVGCLRSDPGMPLGIFFNPCSRLLHHDLREH